MVLNGLTPESETRTHYFWSTTRPWGLGDKKVDEIYRSMIEVAFNEDKAIVEAQQRLIERGPGERAASSISRSTAPVSRRGVFSSV